MQKRLLHSARRRRRYFRQGPAPKSLRDPTTEGGEKARSSSLLHVVRVHDRIVRRPLDLAVPVVAAVVRHYDAAAALSVVHLPPPEQKHKAQPSEPAQHRIAQHSTAQHSTAQHSTAQHSA